MDCWLAWSGSIWSARHRPQNRINARHLTGTRDRAGRMRSISCGATARWRDDSDLGQAPLIKLCRALYHSLLPLVWTAPSVSGSSPAVSSEPDHVRSSARTYIMCIIWRYQAYVGQFVYKSWSRCQGWCELSSRTLSQYWVCRKCNQSVIFNSSKKLLLLLFLLFWT